jgi:heme oxygenase
MTQTFIKAVPGVDSRPARTIARKVTHQIGTVHRALRSATLTDHAAIDRMLLAFDLSTVDDYRAFLTIHFDALLALRETWRAEDFGDFEQMLRCLVSDLSSLGEAVSVPATAASGKAIRADHALGTAYVIRGSRLGAAVLRHNVACTLATSYLDFVPAVSWKEFLVQLESIAADSKRIDEAIRAARGTFSVFATEFIRANRVIIRPPA